MSGPVSGYEIVQGSGSFGPGTIKSGAAVCPEGKEPISGGGAVSALEGGLGYNNAMNASVVWSHPTQWDASRWAWQILVYVSSGFTGSWRAVAWAVCARVQSD